MDCCDHSFIYEKNSRRTARGTTAPPSHMRPQFPLGGKVTQWDQCTLASNPASTQTPSASSEDTTSQSHLAVIIQHRISIPVTPGFRLARAVRLPCPQQSCCCPPPQASPSPRASAALVCHRLHCWWQAPLLASVPLPPLWSRPSALALKRPALVVKFLPHCPSP
jgi:hypothetical protein